MTEHHLRVDRTARYHVLPCSQEPRSIWVVLHGYGQLARFFLTKFEGLCNDQLIVAPEGLSRYYLDKEHSRVGATWMTREDRELEIKDHVGYLDRLVAALKNEHGDLPVNALGFSQGVATASRWSIMGNTKPARLVLWAGGIPPEASSTILQQAWGALSVDLVLGTRDEFANDQDLTGMSERLRRAKVTHHVHRFEGTHILEPVLLKRLLNA